MGGERPAHLERDVVVDGAVREVDREGRPGQLCRIEVRSVHGGRAEEVADRAVAESEERFRSVVENTDVAPVGVVAT